MTPISICIIMKNEEKHLELFLSSIQEHMGNYPYELILVDTGSTDHTKEIASCYTDKIYHFQWINDFSAARNYSLQCASYDWVLVLDCDEYITVLDTSCFDRMIQQCPQGIGMLSRQNHFEQAAADSIYMDEVERFFNRKLFHYEAEIHEQVRPISPLTVSGWLSVYCSSTAVHRMIADSWHCAYTSCSPSVPRSRILIIARFALSSVAVICSISFFLYRFTDYPFSLFVLHLLPFLSTLIILYPTIGVNFRSACFLFPILCR